MSFDPSSDPSLATIRLVVSTDLDGTLLNHLDYSWQDAAPAIERLRRLGVPLILNSSKTRAEMESLRRELHNRHPFVAENGSAIYVPKGYFDQLGRSTHDASSADAEQLEELLLGPPRQDILDVLRRFRHRHGYRFRGFADFSLQEIQEHTDLSPDAARAAADRAATEPLLWLDDRFGPEVLAQELRSHGWRLVTGGRFLHAMGAVDKGHALGRLLARFRTHNPAVRSMALGDSDNDRGMLEAVDFPVVIPKADGVPWDPGPLPDLTRAPEPGAAGWRIAVEQRLDTLFPTVFPSAFSSAPSAP